ncbi:DNA packaging protein [Aneurinibacillus thermoaerophilus]|uniref:terminase large subunit domain-containing protein n=1 Tax=Aneurinibacillus thermoaerophilus TaxID=143495 RepID=UPI002E1FE01B|nr:DNA packaging protein [Aneurinibacillus thermoaerophilus]MED0761861.1 DNA packaging protein [Aneurinibacillus thermoaerophilus]
MSKLTTQDKLKIIMSDFKLFAKNFIKIIDNNGNSVPFILNPEQEEFISSMEKYNVILKGRQIGFTTLSLAYMLYCACTKPDTSYIIVTHHDKVSKTLFVRLKKMYASLPHKKFPNLFPTEKLNNRDELYLSNGSRIIIATAKGEDAISGNTFQMIHFSEMAKYPSSEVMEEMLATAIPALAKNDSACIVIESTAMGYNYYQELFMKAYRDKGSAWKAFFYNWLADAYKKQFKAVYDEGEQWYKNNNKGVRLSPADLEHDEKTLYERYGASLKQLMWRRYYIDLKSLETFQREFPTTPEEAFASTQKGVFSQSMIQERIHNLIEPITYSECESDLPDILKQYLNKSLFLFHLPKRGQRYWGGIDVASGNGGDADNSTITIIDSDGEQVASFYTNDIPVYKFAEIVATLGRYYNNAFLAIERNSYGLPLIERVYNDHEYYNLMKQKTFDQKGRKKFQRGWQTTQANKSILISDFKEAFETGQILIHCRETLDQMAIYEENNGKMGNKRGKGKHDDLVMSFGLAVQARKVNKYYVDI